MEAQFEVIADGEDITALLRDRLLGITVVDKPGIDSDELEIRLDDRDSRVQFPPKGAVLRVSLGWSEKGLHDMGSYVVDEIEVSGPPDTIVLRGKPADMRQDARSHRSISYESTTLAKVVQAVASRNGWEPVCTLETAIPRLDQVRESDVHFISRVARQYGATATIKAGKLIVLARDAGQSASGKKLPSIVLGKSDLETYSLTFPDRGSFGKVKARAHDTKTGKQVIIDLPNPEASSARTGGEYFDRHVYPNPDAARAAAASRQQGLNRSTATGSLTTIGRADISAESHIILQGFKADIDGQYLVDSTTQSYADKSWQTTIALNAGNEGKAKAGRKKKTGPGQIINLPAL